MQKIIELRDVEADAPVMTVNRPMAGPGPGRRAARWTYAVTEREKPEARMADGTGLDAPITGVTVFRDGARVQRSGTVNVRRAQTVLVSGLPASVDPASVRVAARGLGLALLDVRGPASGPV